MATKKYYIIDNFVYWKFVRTAELELVEKQVSNNIKNSDPNQYAKDANGNMFIIGYNAFEEKEKAFEIAEKILRRKIKDLEIELEEYKNLEIVLEEDYYAAFGVV